MRNPAIAGQFVFCTPSLGGLSRLWVTPFVRPPLLFEPGNTDIVKDIAAPLQWFEVSVDRDNSQLDEAAVRTPNGIVYRTTLSLFFARLKQGTRRGVRELAEGRHTAIAEDTNGGYHLVGHDTPLELSEMRATTDKYRGASGYSLILQSSGGGLLPINAAYVRQRVMNLVPAVCPGVVLGNESVLYNIGNCIVLD